MAYIYQADLWCDDCGSKICETLVKEGKAQGVIPWDDLRADVVSDIPGNELNTAENDALEMIDQAEKGDAESLVALWDHFQLDPQYSKANLDETAYDSDAYPKHDSDPGESDIVYHCAAGEDCENAEHIYGDGRSSRYGALGSMRKVGKLLTERLTEAGVEAVLEQLRTDEDRSPVVLFWMANIDNLDWPKDLYTVKLENSDDDPTQVNAYVHGPYADEWCDAVGALTGSSWECADGPEFCYDSFLWEPGLVEGLRKEGFDLDLSEYSDPDSEELLIARHASECKACEYDYRRAETHLDGRILWRLPNAPNVDGFESAWDAMQCARNRRLDLVTDESGECYATYIEPEAYEAPSPAILSFRKSAHDWFDRHMNPPLPFDAWQDFDPIYPHR